MEVKICGLCRPEDATVAAEAGADYVGVVLTPGLRRSQSLERAEKILGAAAGAKRVGVFVNSTVEELAGAGARLGLDVLQLHGTEPPELLLELRGAGPWRLWKAIRPRSREEFLAGVDAYGGVADALVVDGWSDKAAGGAGARFPWEEVAAARGAVPAEVRLVVAGGLHPGNVAEAVARLAPDVVDVSSGVERVVGEKAPELVREFVAAARAAAGEGASDGRPGAG
jgi:phosphoribosylanthranilate isomerase